MTIQCFKLLPVFNHNIVFKKGQAFFYKKINITKSKAKVKAGARECITERVHTK
jgi:hypothetical protein